MSKSGTAKLTERSVSKDAMARQPARTAFREELTRRIDELGLTSNVADLDLQGYTVVRDAAPLSFFEELREAILELQRERRAAGVVGDPRGLFSESIQDVIRKGRVFEQAILNPKLNALMAYLLGDGYVLNASSASVLEQGCAALYLHSDNAYVPDPFPSWALTATSVWATDEFTVEGGASRVVPGSHHYARQVGPGEGEDEAIPIECPAGSILVWNGATWHGNCGRSLPGKRVALHTSFCRLHIRSFCNNNDVEQEIVDRNGPLMEQILGRKLPFGNEPDGPRPDLRSHTSNLYARRL